MRRTSSCWGPRRNFRRSSEGAENPYGLLRDFTGERGRPVYVQLIGNQNAPIYVHSVDADAPNFEAREVPDQDPTKVLDRYDAVLAAEAEAQRGEKSVKYPHFIIGGYNLFEPAPRKEGEDAETYRQDYAATMVSNMIDMAIRKGIHAAAPEMTYPTEPNSLIKASTYYNKKAGGSNGSPGHSSGQTSSRGP